MKENRFFRSLRDAMSGVQYAFYNERNFRIQFFVGCIAMIMAAFFPLSEYERLLIVVVVFSVLLTELLNTAMEKLLDLLKPRLHYYVKTVKDIMGAVVLTTSFGALIVGVVIFLPYVIKIFTR